MPQQNLNFTLETTFSGTLLEPPDLVLWERCSPDTTHIHDMLSASRRVFAAVTRQSVLASKTTTKHINLRAVSRPPFQVAHFATTSSSSDRNQPASTQKGKVQADPRIVNFAVRSRYRVLCFPSHSRRTAVRAMLFMTLGLRAVERRAASILTYTRPSTTNSYHIGCNHARHPKTS